MDAVRREGQAERAAPTGYCRGSWPGNADHDGDKTPVHGRGMGIVFGVGAFNQTPFFFKPVNLIFDEK
jgi:hypothetical protein